MDDGPDILAHYDRRGLVETLRAALAAAGLGEGRLSSADLAPLDQFHSRGLAATVEMAEALEIGAETRILDVGSGLGGPSRYLAERFGCRVTGIDLSPAFVEAAGYLADRAGLGDRVAYLRADALDLPFPDGSFDLVWTQHVAMNIADRAGLYGGIRRVLRSGGTLALYDVVAGTGGPPHFPAPWARDGAASFLLTPDALRAVLEATGFVVRTWRDRSPEGRAWSARQRAERESGAPAPALSLALAMGPDFPRLAANLGRSLAEDRVGLVEAVLEA